MRLRGIITALLIEATVLALVLQIKERVQEANQ